MAICTFCDQEMLEATSCTASELHRGGKAVAVFPYGDDPGWPARGRPCPDCGVEPGGFHHLGCDIQACPRCRDQLIMCGCDWDELAEDDDEGEEVGDAALLRAGLTPFAGAVAHLRARYHAEVTRLAAWALERGRAVDRDVAAFCLDGLEQHRVDGRLRLDRPDVMHLLRIDLWNAASSLRTLLPDHLPEAVWVVLTWLHEEGQLVDSAPLAVLREPLGCYAGLGDDGVRLPPGADVEFACQCWVPYDAMLPPGVGRCRVAWGTDGPLWVRARLHPRSAGVAMGDEAPLLRFAQQTALHLDRPIDTSPFEFAGRTVPGRSEPELWLYRDPDDRWGTPLAVDSSGEAWVPRLDRRRRQGFRWVRTGAVPALSRTGFFERSTPAAS